MCTTQLLAFSKIMSAHFTKPGYLLGRGGCRTSCLASDEHMSIPCLHVQEEKEETRAGA